MFIFNFLDNLLWLDFATKKQILFQDAATSIMHGIINLHHHIMCLLVFVLIFVGYIFKRTYLFSVYVDKYKLSTFVNLSFWYTSILVLISSNLHEINYFYYKFSNYLNSTSKLLKWSKYDVSHGTILEIIWTFIPSFILLLIVGPSFNLLYSMDTCVDPDITVKIIGHQWYWTYEYNDSFLNYNNKSSRFKNIYWLCHNLKLTENMPLYFIRESRLVEEDAQFNIVYDSYMLAFDDLSFGDLRLLEVDNPLFLPTNYIIRLDITASDVIHSFAVPSLGIKLDAIPGRINVAYVEILRTGVYFGQCSELCGVNHGFMPIKIIATDSNLFFFNLLSNIELGSFSVVSSLGNFYEKKYFLSNVF